MKKFYIALAAFLLVGCGGKDKELVTVGLTASEPPSAFTPTPELASTAIQMSTPAPTEYTKGKAQDSLTGLYIDEELAMKRPYAVVINNLRKAWPQSGLAQAGLYYEVLAEGEITRIIALFRDFDAVKIGPVRSTRHYFLDFALDNDAIFVHHGGSPQGYAAVKNLRVNNIDGMRDGHCFWRDPVRVSKQGMYEHSSYTSAENIRASTEKNEFRTDLDEGFEPGVGFYESVAFPADGKLMYQVSIPYSANYKANFRYDFLTGAYLRFQGGQAQIDEATGEQLAVTNVLVQFVNMYVLAGDDAGRREVELVGSGKGLLFTGGQYTEVTWKKDSHGSPTEWFDASGGRLLLNKGKTWICLYQKGGNLEIE